MTQLPADILSGKVLLATDGSPDAEQARRVAGELASKAGAELHVVHVWGQPHFYPESVLMPESAARFRDLYERAGRELLAEQVRGIERDGASVAEAHLEEGDPASEIGSLGQQLGVGLIVMGSRGLGTVKRLVVGSVSEGVVHLAAMPVLVVRGGEGAWPPRRIVVGDDGSDDAERAGELAARIGSPFRASLDLVHAFPPPPGRSQGERLLDPHAVADALRETRQVLQRRADGLEGILGQPPRVHLSEGDPASAILGMAGEGEGPALIAVGSRGLNALERLRLGSVSSKVLRAATYPVLICPHTRTGAGSG